MMLFDFSDKKATDAWGSIDDRVMGGISRSDLDHVEHDDTRMAMFHGVVSTENNGGFCSVRANLSTLMEPSSSHVQIRCCGNQQSDKTYYLNLRTNTSFDGLSYRTSFRPGATFINYERTTSEFEPVFRGRTVSDAPALNFQDVRQIGLMISDYQRGPFELLIESISAHCTPY